MKNNFLFLLLIATTLSVVSCRKGDTGAQGPQGNANVYSAAYTVSPSAWATYGTYGTTEYGYEVQIPDGEITTDIITNGAVLVYLVNTDGSISQLPYSYAVGANLVRSFYFTTGNGGVAIDYEDSDFQTTPPGGNYSFKIVAIAGAQLAKLHITPAQAMAMSYQQVKTTFNISK